MAALPTRDRLKVLAHAGSRIKIPGLSSPQPSYHTEHATTANKEEILIKCIIYKLVLRVLMQEVSEQLCTAQ